MDFGGGLGSAVAGGRLSEETADADAAPSRPVDEAADATLDLPRGADRSPGPPPEAPAASDGRTPRTVRTVLLFLGAGMVGVAVMLAGLVWDAVIHARDPAAGHAEASVFSLNNPAHQLLLVGGALAVAGLTAGTARALALSAGRRLASSRTAAVLVVVTVVGAAVTGGVVRWASTAELPIATGPLAPNPGPDTHGIGIVNSHAPGPCRPTKAEKDGAAKLIADTEAGTARYKNFAAALADGYTGPANPAFTEHYSNIPYTVDGRVLDPTRPEALMYTPTAHGMVLVGVMYLMNVPGEFGPEPGGCLTRWHVHANLCFSATTFQPVSQVEGTAGTCPDGTFRYIPPPALHVWFVDVPGGRFAPEVDGPYLAKKLGP